MKPPTVAKDRPIVTPDGRLTLYGYDLLKWAIDTLKAHEARIGALEP